MDNLKLDRFQINDIYDIGKHEINWDASNKSSGIYFIELKTNRYRDIKKVTLIK